ncbi:MAG: DegV family protein [Bacilli bacterium]|jgi:DegV family protein with EDD domain|nr:DegV family protein [Bacilli bacterium]
MALKIIVDSSCGYSKEEAEAKGYFYVPLQITLLGKTYTEGVDITADEFYALLGKGELPHTSQPSPMLYQEVFDKASKDGDEVLLLSISSKVSGAFQAANIAKNDCEHPEKIHLFDTLSFFGGILIFLNEVEKIKEEPIEVILEDLEELRPHIHVFAGMDTLEYVYKGGRLSKFHFALGIFMHAKAIGTLDDGSVVLAGKALGTSNAMKFIIEKSKEYPVNWDYPCYLLYSSEKSILDRFSTDFFYKAYPEHQNLPIIQIDPLIGSHIGPLVYGIFYVAGEREKHKLLIQRIKERLTHKGEK